MSIHVAANGNISFFFHASLLLKVLLHLGSRTPRCEKFSEETEWIQGWSVSHCSTATLPAGLCSFWRENPLPGLSTYRAACLLRFMALPPFAKRIIPQPGSIDTSPFSDLSPPLPPYKDLGDDIEPTWIFQNTVYLRVPNLITSVIHIPGIRTWISLGRQGQGIYTLYHTFLRCFTFSRSVS